MALSHSTLGSASESWQQIIALEVPVHSSIIPSFCEEGDGAASALALQARRAMVDFLATKPWDHFATLTIRLEPGRSCEALVRTHFERRWIRVLEKAAQRRVRWFWAVEGGTGDTRRHVHALIGGTATLDDGWMQSHWKLGLANISAIRNTADSVSYLLKTGDHKWDNYDIDRPSKRDISAASRIICPF